MNNPNWKSCTEEDLWKYVGHHLAANDISTILVGGAVAAIYSEGAYRSGDLDFVVESLFTDKIPEIMKKIGFEKGPTRHYQHPECSHIFIEFCSPPAAIGDDLAIKARELKIEGQVLRIYSPTDCIRDRLASYIHFKAKDCLEQAILVARRQTFDSKKVQTWCKAEGAPDAYKDFIDGLKYSERV
jgi:hypothetical protein